MHRDPAGHRIARCSDGFPRPDPRRRRPRRRYPLARRIGALPRLKVSDEQRFLVTADGRPFFWLGDTAWELFHRLNREEAERYLKNRAAQRFTVIQAVALAEFDGLHDAERVRPHAARATTIPTQPNEAYFAHVDWIVAKRERARALRRLAADVGRQVEQASGAPARRSSRPQNAEQYGEWLGRRYKDAGIIWILGGDRPVETDAHKRDHPRDGARACARATAART